MQFARWRLILASCLDSVTLIFFRLAPVVCRRIFEVIKKFEEKWDISMILKNLLIPPLLTRRGQLQLTGSVTTAGLSVTENCRLQRIGSSKSSADSRFNSYRESLVTNKVESLPTGCRCKSKSPTPLPR